jgi:hypothetical protein
LIHVSVAFLFHYHGESGVIAFRSSLGCTLVYLNRTQTGKKWKPIIQVDEIVLKIYKGNTGSDRTVSILIG